MNQQPRIPQEPPDNVPASELWATLTQMPRPHRLVDFPRNLPGTTTPVGKTAIWPLTQEEQMICAAAAERFAREKLRVSGKSDEQSLGYETVYHNQAAVEIICRACRRPENLRLPTFPSPADVRREFTADEVGVLFAHYLRVRSEVGPIIANMTDEECEAWIERLVEAGDSFPLSLLSPELQDYLTLYLARQYRSLRTVISSAGSRADGTPSDSDERSGETLLPADDDAVTDEFG